MNSKAEGTFYAVAAAAQKTAYSSKAMKKRNHGCKNIGVLRKVKALLFNINQSGNHSAEQAAVKNRTAENVGEYGNKVVPRSHIFRPMHHQSADKIDLCKGVNNVTAKQKTYRTYQQKNNKVVIVMTALFCSFADKFTELMQGVNDKNGISN